MFSNTSGPSDALSLRFHMFLGLMSIWTYVFQYFWALGRSRSTPVLPNRPEASKGRPPLVVKGGVLGPGREPLRRVQGPLLLIQYTCYLILDTRHLILDTCTYTYTYTIPYTYT